MREADVPMVTPLVTKQAFLLEFFCNEIQYEVIAQYPIRSSASPIHTASGLFLFYGLNATHTFDISFLIAIFQKSLTFNLSSSKAYFIPLGSLMPYLFFDHKNFVYALQIIWSHDQSA